MKKFLRALFTSPRTEFNDTLVELNEAARELVSSESAIRYYTAMAQYQRQRMDLLTEHLARVNRK